MHDPLVVAFSVRRPWPERSKMRLSEGTPRWEWKRHGPWWKPGSWSPFVMAFGRRWFFPSMITVWHVEPGGHDSGEVCKHRRKGPDEKWRYTQRWRWHVWHWRIQISLEQKLRRFLFERCERCGHRYPWGYAPVSHQWDGPKSRWFRVQKHAYHHECSALGSREQQVEQLEGVIRGLVAMYRTALDLSEEEAVDRLTGHSSPWPFHVAYRLQGLLGWERDSNYKLRRSADVKAEREAERVTRRAVAKERS